MSYLKDREIWLSNVPTGNPPAGYFWKFIQNGKVVVRDSSGNNQIMVATSGSQAITGSLTVTGGITGTVSSASYVEYSNVANKPTLVSGSSQIAYSGLTGIPSGIVSGSAQIASFGIFATTGSNGFNGSQSITGSLTVTGQVVAQTLNVQQVTSSIVYSSGSNIFGNSLANTQQLTGSVGVTGSLTVTTSGTELQVTNTGVNLGNALTDSHIISGSITINPGGLFVSGSGNVGIGTTSPAQKLQINGPLALGNLAEDFTTNQEYAYPIVYAGNLSGLGNGELVIQPRTTATRSIRFVTRTSGAVSSTNPDTRMIIRWDGNVGIGTTSPSTLLHVSGSSASIGRIVSTFALSSGFSDVVQILNPNQTGGGLSFNIGKAESTRNLGKIVYAHSSDGSTSNRLAFGFYDADNLLNLTAGGNVLVNTTSVASLGNGIALRGDNNGVGGYGYIQISGTGSTTRGIYLYNTNGLVGSVGTDGTSLLFATGGSDTERMRISSTGAATFSSTVTSTGFIISADQLYRMNGFNSAYSYMTTNAGFSSIYNGVGIFSNATNANSLPAWALDLGGLDGPTIGGVTDGFAISRKASGGAWANFFRIASTGAVTFSSSVTATSSVNIQRASTTNSNAVVWSTSGTGDWFLGSSPLGNSTSDLSLYSYGTSSVVLNFVRSTGAATFSSSVAGYGITLNHTSENLRLKMGAIAGGVINIQGEVISSGGVYPIVLNNNGGNVGIGITSPGARLQVRGANELSTFFDAQNEGAAGATFARVGNSFPFNHYTFANGTVYIGTSSNPLSNATPLLGIVAGTTTDVINIRHNQNGNNAVNIWQTGTSSFAALTFYKGDAQGGGVGNIICTTSGTTYNTTSDYRLKTNIAPIENGIDRLMQLKPSKFNWIETGNEAEGFIAHELQEIFPDAVTGEKDAIYSSTGNIKPQSVDYGRITPLLVKAIQEQQTLIESLKSRIEILEQ